MRQVEGMLVVVVVVVARVTRRPGRGSAPDGERPVGRVAFAAAGLGPRTGGNQTSWGGTAHVGISKADRATDGSDMGARDGSNKLLSISAGPLAMANRREVNRCELHRPTTRVQAWKLWVWWATEKGNRSRLRRWGWVPECRVPNRSESR